jgi:thiamine kinase-like enzyme
MLLSEHNVFYYLLDQGMMDTESVVNGEFSARRNDSRNNNFVINREFTHHGYFIKQVRARDAEKTETLRAEAACYQLAEKDPRFAALKNSLPKFHHYDTKHHILVVDQVRDVQSLHDHYFSNQRFDKDIPQKLAGILAACHRTDLVSNTQNQEAPLPFRMQKPWLFTIASQPPQQWMGGPPSAEQQTMQMIFKNPEYVQLLAQCEPEWQPYSLIHNDIKFPNFLLSVNPETQQVKDIKLIDWELADIGDPIWDVAGLLYAYLQLWISTDLPEAELKMYPNFKKILLPQLQPSMDIFWQSYKQQMGWDEQTAAYQLLKAVRYTALRLIHGCFEAAPYTRSLQPSGAKMLQISFNILRAPAGAITQLFGIKNSVV